MHGLRSFKFDLTVQNLPINKSKKNESNAFDELLNLLTSKPWMKVVTEGLHYEANISKDYKVKLKKWFQISNGFDINFVSPDDDLNFFNRPLYALSIEVIINSSIGKFSPRAIQDQIVRKISDEVLNVTKEDQWWHLITSPIKSIIYLHDISEPREILLTCSKTFVKTKSNSTQNEYTYSSLLKRNFDVLDEEDDSIWIHKKTGIHVIQLFEQKINPVELYNYQIFQLHQLKKIVSYNFFAVENISSSMIMRVRRLLHNEWIAFQYNDDTLIWAIEPSIDISIIKFHHDKILSIGLKLLQVEKEDVERLLEDCQKELLPSMWMFTSNTASISFPIMLNRRIFWLSKDLEINHKCELNEAIELLKYKYSYENNNGFDQMEGKKEQKFTSLEMREMLFDIFTVRGKRMLDISIYNNPISINLRFKEGYTGPSNDLVINYIKEFDVTYKHIKKMLNNKCD